MTLGKLLANLRLGVAARNNYRVITESELSIPPTPLPLRVGREGEVDLNDQWPIIESNMLKTQKDRAQRVFCFLHTRRCEGVPTHPALRISQLAAPALLLL